MAPVAGISTIIALVIEAAYFSLLWASGGRATIGMRLLKLQVGDATTGNRIPIASAFRRWLGVRRLAQPDRLRAGAGRRSPRSRCSRGRSILLVTTASHPQKMGLHDRFANTAMVRPANAGNAAGIVIGCLADRRRDRRAVHRRAHLPRQPGLGDPVDGRGVRLTDGAGDTDPIGEDQRTGLRDMDPDAFRAAAHEVVDRIADYLAGHRALPGPAADRARLDRPAAAVRRRPRSRSRSRRSSRTSTGWSSRTRPTGSTRGSSPTSPPAPRARDARASSSPRRSGRTRCCGARRRSGRSSRASSSAGCARRSGCRTRSTAS